MRGGGGRRAGGEDNHPADRALGEAILRDFPAMGLVARAQRTFLARAITYLAAERGVRQFLDLGTGLPTHNNTHEIAQKAAPEARVVYVDSDPLVPVHARALLVGTEEGAIAYIDEDVRNTEAVPAEASRTLDLEQPVAVTTLGILAHTLDEDTYPLVRSYTSALPSGSFLAVADGTDTDEGMRKAAEAWNADAVLPYHLRSIEGISAFFDDLELVGPGVVPALEWHAPQQEIGQAQDVAEYCGLARVP